EVHKKFALPAACLAFGLLGLPLGIVNRRGGRAAGFAVSVAIVVGYYVLFATGEARAIDGRTSAFLAMWMPNFILFALALAALVRVRRASPLFPALAFGGGSRSSAPDAASGTPRRRLRFGARSLLLDRYVAARFFKLFVLVVVSILVLYVVID